MLILALLHCDGIFGMDNLEVEIRKLLHEVSRIAEQALNNARKAREKGGPAVEAAVQRLDQLKRCLKRR